MVILSNTKHIVNGHILNGDLDTLLEILSREVLILLSDHRDARLERVLFQQLLGRDISVAGHSA